MQTTRRLELHADMIDRLLEHYCAWREECAEVQAAYERFSTAPMEDQGLAYAAYVAALDREDAAAWMYAVQINLVSSRVTAEPYGDATLLQGFAATR
jgi:hypothetical protein